MIPSVQSVSSRVQSGSWRVGWSHDGGAAEEENPAEGGQETQGEQEGNKNEFKKLLKFFSIFSI